MQDTQGQITCVVGDDHEALLRGLVSLLSAEPDLRVIGSAANGEDTLAITERRSPEITVVDVRMPRMDGIALCREVAEKGLPTHVVLYTAYDDLNVLESALEAGARGYVLKSGPPQDLVRAVRTVHAGQPFIDATLGAALLERRSGDGNPLLSKRELEVLQLLADGHTTDAAATALFLSPTTVRSYAESAMRKLEAANRVHAVALALRLELIR